jgi:hypothetical protein
MSYSRRQLYAFGEPLGDGATRREVGGKTVYGSGGGGGGDQKQTTVTDVPDWVKPYAKESLGKAAALTNAPYQTYGGERVAQFSPLQQQAFTRAGQQQVAGQIGQATGIAGLASQRALEAGNYQPGAFNTMMASGPNLQQYQMGPAMGVNAQQVSSRDIQAAQTGFNPQLQQFQMEGPGSFTQPGTASQYMSPYMDAVVQQQMESAQRQADIAGTQRGAQAVRAGAFGGSRQAIESAEAARALASQKGQIQAQGLQSSFQQAQQQFNQEQQARQQAQQANLQANLGVQQLGTQTGLQTSLANLNNQQQANVQSEANRLQASGMSQDAALRAALANQQAGLTTGQANLQSLLGTQSLGAQTGMQAQLANQQALMDAQRAAEQSRQFGSNIGLQGIQAALQGAGQLGQLGQQQFGQQMDITGQQAQFGGLQRQATQDILTQQYQDFQNQQRAPYDQLSFMNSIIRGTPMGQTTTQYAPPPSTTSQLIGLGTAAAGAYGAYQGAQPRGAAGGEVKSYATGGIASLNQPEMAAMAGGMSDEQLQQTEGLPSITELARMTLAAEAQQRAQMRQQATAQQAMMQQQPQTTVAEEQMAALGGIGDLPAPNLENLGDGMAGGGIIAFAPGGDVGGLGAQYDAAKQAYAQSLENLRRYGGAKKLADPSGYEAARAALQQAEQALQTAQSSWSSATQGMAGPVQLSSGVNPLLETATTPAAAATSGIAGLDAAVMADEARKRAPGRTAAASTVKTPPTGPGRAPRAADTGIAAALPKSIQDLQAKYRGEIEAAGKAGEAVEADRLAATKRDQEELGQPGAEREKRAKAQEKALEGAEGKNFNMALIEAGLAIMAGNSANAFENIGRGAMVGTKAYTTGMNRIQDRKEKLDESMIALDELRYSTAKVDKKELRDAEAAYKKAKQQTATALAAVTGKEADVAVDMYTKQQDARSRENVARIAAGGAGGDSKLIAAAEAAFQRDPEAAAIRKRLENPIGTLNKTKEANDLARLRQIQAAKYKQFGITMEQGAAASSAADPLGLR